MTYSDCPLYGLQSKKKLKYLLYIEDSKLFKQDYIASLVSPYIDKTGKPRLIEPPCEELKAVQKRLKKCWAQFLFLITSFLVLKVDLMQTMQWCILEATEEIFLKLI